MKLDNVFRVLSMKPSKKHDALKKVLQKLNDKQRKAIKDLKSEKSGKKIKKLKTKIKVYKQQRKKAKKMIAELS